MGGFRKFFFWSGIGFKNKKSGMGVGPELGLKIKKIRNGCWSGTKKCYKFLNKKVVPEEGLEVEKKVLKEKGLDSGGVQMVPEWYLEEKVQSKRKILISEAKK